MAANDLPDYEFGGFPWFIERSVEGFITTPCLTRGAARLLAAVIDAKADDARKKAAPFIPNEDWVLQALPSTDASLPEGWSVYLAWSKPIDCQEEKAGDRQRGFILNRLEGLVKHRWFASPAEAEDAAWGMARSGFNM